MVDGRERTDTGVEDVEAAFRTLSHDLRLEILLALWEAPDYSLSFSELRSAVGERDSGKFTYHLSELQGHFVADTEAGYELRYPGHRVLDAIQSGVFHDRAAVGPVGLDAACHDCGGSLAFEYGQDFIGRVRCSECGDRTLEWPFDPGGTVDRTPEETVTAFDRRTRLVWSCALEGVCPFCAGRVDRTFASRVDDHGVCIGVLEDLDRYEEYFARDHEAVISVDCERCSFYSFIPAGVVLLTRPSITGRLSEAGVDVRERSLWELDFVVDPGAVSVSATAPLEVEVTVAEATDPLVVDVDESLEPTVRSAD